MFFSDIKWRGLDVIVIFLTDNIDNDNDNDVTRVTAVTFSSAYITEFLAITMAN